MRREDLVELIQQVLEEHTFASTQECAEEIAAAVIDFLLHHGIH